MAESEAELMDLNKDAIAVRAGVQLTKILMPGILVDRLEGRARSVLPRLGLDIAEVVGYQTAVMSWATGHNEVLAPMLGAIALKKVLGRFLEGRERKVVQEDYGLSAEQMRDIRKETVPVRFARVLTKMIPVFSSKFHYYEGTGLAGNLGAFAVLAGEALGVSTIWLGANMGSPEITALGVATTSGAGLVKLAIENLSGKIKMKGKK